VKRIFRSHGSPAAVTSTVDAGNVSLGIDAAIPCGLILNELISNALKHAFPNGRSGQVRVSLRMLPDSQIRLSVLDTGVGLPENIEIDHVERLGLRLVQALTEQLDGRMDIHRGSGAEFVVLSRDFPRSDRPATDVT